MVMQRSLHILLTVCGCISEPRSHLLHYSADPREFSISTKDFVIDDDGKLKGLNTGEQLVTALFLRWISSLDYQQFA